MAIYGPTGATTANVAASATSVTLFAANDGGIEQRILTNDSSAVLYLKYGATASPTSYTYRVDPAERWEAPYPVYRGLITGIWTAATGNARTTEVS